MFCLYFPGGQVAKRLWPPSMRNAKHSESGCVKEKGDNKMSVKQISVFLENRPGTLNEMTKILADNKIDMRALSVSETKDFGIARLIVDDVFAATNTLKKEGYVASLTPVLAYAVPDEPGGLNKLLAVFAEENINIEYMYAILSSSEHAYMIFRVADTVRAEAAMRGRGFKGISQDEMSLI